MNALRVLVGLASGLVVFAAADLPDAVQKFGKASRAERPHVQGRVTVAEIAGDGF